MPLGCDESDYVPEVLGDWLAADVKAVLAAIFATIWRVERKLVVVERRLQAGKLDKNTIVKYAPLVKELAEALDALSLA